MPKLTTKKSKPTTHGRAVTIKTKRLKRSRKAKSPTVKKSRITQLRNSITRNVQNINKEISDEAYDYAAFSWRGIKRYAQRLVDIYEWNEYGDVTVCLWRDFFDEENWRSGGAIAVFGCSDMLKTIEVINQWMSGATIKKVHKYITDKPDSFLRPDLTID